MPDLTTAEKIAAIEKSDCLLAWDGCHKIYLLTTPEEIADAADSGYGMYRGSDIRECITSSCGLVFVQKWGLVDMKWTNDWTIEQCTEDIYEAAESTSS